MYTEIEPSITFKETIDVFWTYSNNKLNDKFSVLPDLCTDLIFDLNQNKGFLSGVMTSFQLIEIQTQSHLLGIRFKTENFGSLINLPLDEVKNRRIDFSDLNLKLDDNIFCKLRQTNTIEEKTNILEGFVTTAISQRSRKPDELVISVASKIRLLKGKVNLGELANSYYVSVRQLQRRFKHYLGLTIKEFSNIVRFKNSKAMIEQNPQLSFMQIAFRMGYFDHSHLNYDFNRLAGRSPNSFR